MIKRLIVGIIIAGAVISIVSICRQTRWFDLSHVPRFRQKGSLSSPVVLAEFSDFQCKSCAQAQGTLKDLLQQYKGKIRLVFRHYPLKTHKWADLAAKAAESAGVQGHFWEYHDLLFSLQSQWSHADDPMLFFVKYAEDMHLDVALFKDTMASEQVQKWIDQDRRDVKIQNVNMTPTFFVNQRRISGKNQLAAHGVRFVALELKE